jgi:hyperosmotically inducible protein
MQFVSQSRSSPSGGIEMSHLNRVRPILLAAVIACAGLLLSSTSSNAQDKSRANSSATANLQREVGHQLRLLPFLTVFDDLQFQVNGDTVTLSGEVTQPTVKSDAEKAVKGIEGVTSVTNNIQVLPLSPDDSRIRRAVYRAIYSDPGLQVYADGSEQAIHIIVKGGHVTLVGFANTAQDKQVIQNRAQGVPGVFVVDNQLQVSGK